MNLKRYLPLVAVAALILSLVAIFPAFGAGTASFIVPSAIGDANDGFLTVATPDAQTYGRQGGEIGLFYEDDDLNVPIRRVLIPELDGTPVTNVAVEANSNQIVVPRGKLTAGDYVMVGDHNVHRVISVVATPTPVSTTALWFLEKPVSGNVLMSDLDIPDIEFSGFPSDTVRIEGTISPALPSPIAIDVITDVANHVFNPPLDQTDTTKSVKISAAGGLLTTTNPGTHTVSVSIKDGSTDTTLHQHTLTIQIVDPKDTVTLDRPFATSSVDDASTDDVDESLLPVHKITIPNTVLNHDDVEWADNYTKYARAILLDDTDGTGNVTTDNNMMRYRGDNLVSVSNIESTFGGVARITDTADDGYNVGDALHRLTGNRGSSRVQNDDALVVAVSRNNNTSPWALSSIMTDNFTITDVDEDDVFFNDDRNSGLNDGENDKVYLAAWFVERNDTGDAVSVRSQAYRTPTTLALRETWAGSGKFALRIKTVPHGTGEGEYSKPFMDDSGAFNLPVNERDAVTLKSDDSTATLTIETFPPSFTSLSPAHETAGQESRPEISAEVRDGDSGLAEKNIHILFMIEQSSGTTYKTLTPSVDGDVDEISGGFSVLGRLRGADAPSTDAKISWWLKATDNTGNVGYTDRETTRKAGDSTVDDSCPAKTDADGKDLAGAALIEALAKDNACDPYVIFVDNTDPKLLRAETGRHWDLSLLTGDSDDKTEYRVEKAEKSSVLAVFDSYLDAASVSASDFTVGGATPVSASVHNVKVRDDSFDYEKNDAGDYKLDADGNKIVDKTSGDGNSKLHDDSTLDVGLDRGYVFLTLASDLDPSATPNVTLAGEVLDIAENEQDTGKDDEALDRIAPTLTVEITEGVRAVTKDKVNLRITADESVGTPDVTFHEINSRTVDGETTQTVGGGGSGTVKSVSSTEYTAVVNASGANDGLFTIYVEANDAAGGNAGTAGDKTAEVDVDDETEALLFEHDGNIPDMDVDPGKDGTQDEFSTDDRNAYVRIDFSEEADEYDAQTDGDDLDTHDGVTIVSATLGGVDITGDLMGDTDGNTFLYKPADGLSVGDHALEVVAEDAAGNRHPTAQEATITIIEREPFKLKLNPGWNLVSLPGEPADSDINAAIPADRTDIRSVLTYDTSSGSGKWLTAIRGADGLFSGTLTNITATRGYWMQTDGFKSLAVDIPKQSPGDRRVLPTIALAEGWNLIPILDVDGDFLLDDDDKLPVATYFAGLEDLRVYTFNTITGRWVSPSEVQVGKGYWVYVSEAGVVVP